MSYQPSWNNDFDFDCLYVPSWLNDFDFPYLGCGNIIGEFDIPHGEQTKVALSSSSECLVYHGSTIAVELTSTVLPWDVLAFAGEDGRCHLSASYDVSAPQSFGEQVQFDLKTTIIPYLFSNSWHGENADIDVAMYRHFDANIYDGDNTNIGVARYGHLASNLLDGSGANANLQISVSPRKVMSDFVVSHGDEMAASLNFGNVSFSSNIVAGESVAITQFETLQSVDLSESNFPDGHNVESALALVRWFAPNVVVGENFTANMGVVKGGNQWRALAGDEMLASMSAQYDVGVNCGTGEVGLLDLTTRDPIHIATTVYDGHGWYVTMRHLYSAPLYPYPIINDSWLDVAIDPHWLHFHTCRSCKLPIHAWTFHIRLDGYDDIRTQHSAEIETATTIELTTEVYPESVAFAGEFMSLSMDTIVEVDTLNSILVGSGIYPFYLTTEERTNTDHTNPRPDGSSVITDNGSPEHQPEQFWTMRGGEYVLGRLSAERYPEASLTTGTRIDWDLAVYTPWEIISWPGERVEMDLATTLRIGANVWQGETSDATLDEPDWKISHGEQVEFRVKLTYDVEWLETGCLDNEAETTATVEQESFRHSLKARCF